jgi:hypothetical protein
MRIDGTRVEANPEDHGIPAEGIRSRESENFITTQFGS